MADTPTGEVVAHEDPGGEVRELSAPAAAHARIAGAVDGRTIVHVRTDTVVRARLRRALGLQICRGQATRCHSASTAVS